MKFEYVDLYESQFEELVTAICREILGIGVLGFAKGPDGGRDAIFEGTASEFPSTKSPLIGKMIIQAKHTDDPIGKFSDSEFCSKAVSSVLSKEIPRIKKLKTADELDHYLMFSNRRLGAESNKNIKERIINETGVSSVHIFGIETLDGYLKRFPAIRESLNINPVDVPLRASPDEIANVIVALNKQKEEIAAIVKTKKIIATERTYFIDKNHINGLSKDYADFILRKYLKDFDLVKNFLENPINDKIFDDYQTAVDEFNAEIIQHKNSYHTFDDLLNYLCSMLFKRDRDLSSNKRLTRLVVYYMYWSCDIGKENHAKAI